MHSGNEILRAKAAEIVALRTPQDVTAALLTAKNAGDELVLAAAALSQATKVAGDEKYTQLQRHTMAWDILCTQYDRCAKFGGASSYRMSERQLNVVSMAIYQKGYEG